MPTNRNNNELGKMFPENGGGMQCCNDSFPDGKTQRRERRRRAIRRRKGRL